MTSQTEYRRVQQLKITKEMNIALLVDYNVETTLLERSTTPFKLLQTLPTLRLLLTAQPRAIHLITHLGRPTHPGEIPTAPLLPHVRELLKMCGSSEELPCLETVDLSEVLLSATPPSSGLALSSNLRDLSAEEWPRLFAKYDAVVNDAFGSAHRWAPQGAWMGLLMERELRALLEARNLLLGTRKEQRELPSRVQVRALLILGGAKEDKLDLIEILGDTWVFIGSGLYRQARRRYNTDKSCGAASVTKEGPCVIFPRDLIVKRKGSEKYQVIREADVTDEDILIDVGPESVTTLLELAGRSAGVVWNGPLGDIHSDTSSVVALNSSKATSAGLMKLASEIPVYAGGGETMEILGDEALTCFRHVSTGGGAMLQLLSGKDLPGILNCAIE